MLPGSRSPAGRGRRRGPGAGPRRGCRGPRTSGGPDGSGPPPARGSRGGVLDREGRRQQRLLLALEHQRAGGEHLGLVAAQRTGQHDPVALRHLRLRGDDPMQEGAVVGESSRPDVSLSSRPTVESAGSPPAPALRQQAVDEGASLLVRAGDAEGLVEHHHQPGRRSTGSPRTVIRSGRSGVATMRRSASPGPPRRAGSRRREPAPGPRAGSRSRDWRAAGRAGPSAHRTPLTSSPRTPCSRAPTPGA